MFRGTFTALVTPFRDGQIDVPAFEKLIEAKSPRGSPASSRSERPAKARRFRTTSGSKSSDSRWKSPRGRCQVLAGTGSYSTSEAIAATVAAEKLGVDGALIVAPYYNKPSQEGLFRHFRAIAQATALRIMLYNIPGRCGVDIDVAHGRTPGGRMQQHRLDQGSERQRRARDAICVGGCRKRSLS